MNNAKKVVTPLMVLGLALCLTSAKAGETALSFDKGFDASEVLGELKAQPVAAEGILPSPVTATRQCAQVSFMPGQAATSAPMPLTSTVYRKVCGQYYGKKVCDDKTIQSFTRSVSLDIKGAHNLLPWEKEAFNVCLQADKVTTEMLSTAYQYSFLPSKAAGEQFMVELQAGKKLATRPDPQGIAVQSFAQDQAGGLTLTFKDKWAANYKGEMTGLSVTLKRVVPLWFPATEMSFELKKPAADAYTVNFAAMGGDFKQFLKPGEKYFVDWSFRREGKISLGDKQAGGRTERVELALPK